MADMQIQTAEVTISVLEVTSHAPAFRVKVVTPAGTVFWSPTYGLPLSDDESPENRLAAAALELVSIAIRPTR